MSRRAIDMRAEQELAQFLDKKLYPEIVKGKSDSGWKRNYDIPLQKRGVDGKLIINGQSYIVDEKATLYYINRNLPTFAFEIDSYQGAYLTKGWLFAPEYLTTHYMLIYPNATHNDLRVITSNDFQNTTCIFVSRSRIVEYLKSNGYDQKRIEDDSCRIRAARSYGKNLIPGINDFYYFLSTPSSYSEAPFNVIIRRRVLEKLADFVITV